MSLFGRNREPGRGTRFDPLVDWLIVGLGNPGKEYARSRHNVGAQAVELVTERAGLKLKAGRDRARVVEARIGDHRVVLAVPTTYMNLSGEAVSALVRRYGIERPEQVVIVQDELDFPPGRLQVKAGGGLAGHNGLRSIAQHLKSQDFARVRIGVGKPLTSEHGKHHVLSKIPKAERELLDVVVQRAADAIEAICADGVDATMQKFNSLDG